MLQGELIWVRNALLMVGAASIRPRLLASLWARSARGHDYFLGRGNGDDLRHERNTPLIRQVLKIATHVPGQRWKEDSPLP